jgi:putative membrane protein
MKKITTIFVAAIIAAALPTTLRADAGTYERSGTTHVSHRDASFIRDAAEGNAAEISMAELALRKSQNPQVRDYAQQLLRDHRQSNRELQQIAEARGISWPVPIKKSDSREMQRAENMSGQDFDRMVMNHWVKDHRTDIKEFDKAARRAEDPQVKQFAITSLPVLRDHLNRAEAITTSGTIREPAGAANHKLMRDDRY